MIAQTRPAVVYGTLTDDDITRIGIEAAVAAFEHAIESGRTQGTNLYIRAAIQPDGEAGLDMVETGTFNVNDGEQYAPNTTIESGKLATVNRYRMDSDAAVYQFGLDDVADGNHDDPRGWTGGAFDEGVLRLDNGMALRRSFAMACSGDYGHIDREVSKAGTAAMVSAWALDQKTRYETA